MDNNINTLDELNKGCSMGIDAINYILSKVKEEKFSNLLEEQLKAYQDLSKKIDDLYHDYTTSDLHKTTVIEKAMTWYGIQMDTMMDNSVSKMADLLIRGTNMGIIEGKKLLNNKTMDKKVHKVCSEFIDVQEKYIEKLKSFL